LEAGAVQETSDWVFAAPVAVTDVGAPGTAEGITADVADDATDVPRAFVAVTVNVYEVPLVRPFTVQNSAPSVTQVFKPGDDVTVYAVTVAPPHTAAVHETTLRPFSAAVADTPVGAYGILEGMIEAVAPEAEPVPLTFVAVTVNV